MNCVAVKINFLTHSMAQGKKQEPLAQNGIPSPSSNIQEAVIQGFTVRGKDAVSLHLQLDTYNVTITQPVWIHLLIQCFLMFLYFLY